jgi:myo-inositol-1(or 4)-monophosphatase
MKEGHELVTAADLMSEKFLNDRLAEIYPEARFIGEEGWSGDLPQGPLWIVDPLDGTNNFVHGYPVFSVSIALWDGSELISACVHDPMRGETFTAESGGGAFLDGERIAASGVSGLSDSLFATGFPYNRREGFLGLDLSILEYFLERVQGIRRGGSAALDISYVACGRLDGFWEESLKPWDMAAGVLLAREAGGSVSDIGGGSWTLSSKGIAVSGPAIHTELLKGILRENQNV